MRRNRDVSRVVDLRATFAGATEFRSDVSGWKTGQVQSLYGTFAYLPFFNSNMADWDVSSVEDMTFFLLSSSAFQQNLCSWGPRLPENTLFGRTFEGTTCNETGDPDMSADPPGPFCARCTEVRR